MSVVIPVRNRPRSVLNAINSALAQTVPPVRILVVDDGSTDTTRPEVERLTRDVPLLGVVSIAHCGPANARNLGLAVLDAEEAPGQDGHTAGEDRLIAFLDSDDTWPPDFLERAQQRLLADPRPGFAVADRLECCHHAGAKLYSACCFDTDPWHALLRQSPRIMSCAVFRRSVLGPRPFPADCLIGEDSALLIRLLADGARPAWIAGAPVAATRIPPGDQDRLTSGARSAREKVEDRLGSALTYAAALQASSASIPAGLANRLLAARWTALLVHAILAGEHGSAARALAELRHCGVKAIALGLFDHFRVLTGRFDSKGKASPLTLQGAGSACTGQPPGRAGHP